MYLVHFAVDKTKQAVHAVCVLLFSFLAYMFTKMFIKMIVNWLNAMNKMAYVSSNLVVV